MKLASFAKWLASLIVSAKPGAGTGHRNPGLGRIMNPEMGRRISST